MAKWYLVAIIAITCSLAACGPTEPEIVIETVERTREVTVMVEVPVTQIVTVEVTREVEVEVTRLVEVERVVTATPTPTPVFSLTEENLSLALISLDDLGAGWTGGITEEPEEEGETYRFICTDLKRRASSRAVAEFEQGQLGPFLTQYVAVYPSGQAEEALADMAAAIDVCSDWTDVSDDGTVYNWEVTPMAFPSLGDETLAIRVSTADIPIIGLFQIDQVYVRHGDVILGVSFGELGLGGVDSEQTEAFVRLALEKLQGLAGVG